MPENDTVVPATASPAATDPPPVGGRPEAAQAGPGPAVETPEMAALKRERGEIWDRLLRKTAEFDNYRKRIERERRGQTDQAVADLLTELLSVVDDLERALAADADDSTSAYRTGVKLIHGKLHDLLQKHGVRPFEALGADFDPNVHQAMAQEVSDEHRDGEVIGEMRRGYMIGDRLLRPAMVKVAKA